MIIKRKEISDISVEKSLFCGKVLKAGVLAALILAMSIGVGVSTGDNPYLVDTYTVGDGQQIDKVIVPGKPSETLAPVVPETTMLLKNLPSVPAYKWSYGCSATSGAMMAGYYDNNGYPDAYTGSTNGGVAPMNNWGWGSTVYPGVTCEENPLSATHCGYDGRITLGHVDDYWIDYGNPGPDPFITGGWPEHAYGDCTGDYMKTNQCNYGNSDASTTFWYFNDGSATHYADLAGAGLHIYDGGCGLQMFFESRGYTVTDMYNQYILGYVSATKGFTFAQYKQEIDAGRPVLIHVKGHTMLGYGYDDATNTVYLHDTWDYNNHAMPWGGTYPHSSGPLQHIGVTVIQLQSLPPVITSCNQAGGEVNQFAPSQSVYAKGSGLESGTNYKIWIQDDPVSEGDSLVPGEDDSGSQENVITDGSGNFGPTEIWAIPGDAPITHHEYDIVVDKQGDGTNTGKYNAASDGIDSATVVGFTAPIPEFTTIAIPVVAILGLLFLFSRRKRKE